MCHITEAELAPALLFCMFSRYFSALQCHFLLQVSLIVMQNASGDVKILKMHRRASRAISYGNSCVVIWHVVLFRQENTDRPIDHVSVQQAIWLLVRVSSDLDAKEGEDLQELCQVSSELAALHTLAQAFGQIVRKREGDQLSGWMKQVEASCFRQVKRFVAGLQRDEEEVLAGLTVVYSNGQVEGFVNKLKLIKRMGYGRANFPLLRQRVLHAL
jgi:Transposase